jgi:hypothetical protein
MRLLVVGIDFTVHQGLDLVGIEVARHHHAQVVGHELHHMVVAAHRGVLLEYLGLVGRLDVLLDRHQALLAGLLQDVVEQRHQFHVARLGVFGAFERLRDQLDGGLEHLGLVVDDEGAQAAPKIVISSNGSAVRITPMLPPWKMYTPKMHPMATT